MIKTGLPLAVALTLPAVLAGGAIATTGNAGHDYTNFHTAGLLVARGISPYDRRQQARVQHAIAPGFPLEIYESLGFLPYNYPPWLALACVPLARLPYPVARAVWVYLGF